MSDRLPLRPSPAHVSCASCLRALDALRAGQVAIVDGRFQYFCNAACKASYFDEAMRTAASQANTLEPPPVAVASEFPPPVTAAPTPPSFRTSHELPLPVVPSQADSARVLVIEPAAATASPPPVMASSPVGVQSFAPAASIASDDPPSEPASDVELATAIPPPVESMRPSVVTPLPTNVHSASNVDDVLAGIGIVSGLGAAVIPLAGSSASALQLPLAFVAICMVLARGFLSPRGSFVVHPVWVVAPAVLATATAIASAVAREPHQAAHATFAGLASMTALLNKSMFGRVQSAIRAWRTHAAEGLAGVVRLRRGEQVSECAAADVCPGDEVLVEAGETVLVDGVVVRATNAEVAPWYNCPVLVNKREGEPVIAGALLASGSLCLRATAVGDDRAWLKLHQVPSGAEAGVPLVRLARRSSEVVIAASMLLVGAAAFANKASWIEIAVAACAGACAGVLLAAVEVVALLYARTHLQAIGSGILYKDWKAMDSAGRAEVSVFCSRGTILLGEPEVVAIEVVSKDAAIPSDEGGAPTSMRGTDQLQVSRLLALAAGAERSFAHPFATAIVREARSRGVEPEAVRSAMRYSGLGVTATHESGARILVGSKALMVQERVSVALADARATEFEAQGRSVLFVAEQEKLVGLIALQDGLRVGARAAVRRMHDAHIEPVLLSGESRETCESMASSLDIDHVRPEILPSDRGAEVRALAEGGRVVAVLGHASTDDGALAAAHVSVALHAAGVVPNEWSVSLASDDVRHAALSLTLARQARERSRAVLVVAGLCHATGALAVVFGLAPAYVAALLAALGVVVGGLYAGRGTGIDAAP